MPMLEVFVLQTELLQRLRALFAVPAVGAEDAVDVEEDVGDRQVVLRCRSRNLHRNARWQECARSRAVGSTADCRRARCPRPPAALLGATRSRNARRSSGPRTSRPRDPDRADGPETVLRAPRRRGSRGRTLPTRRGARETAPPSRAPSLPLREATARAARDRSRAAQVAARLLCRVT